jgi:uroporphyrin-III C-methyltransferase
MKTWAQVSLVGAGPGDPELLTLKAVRAIAQADVILVDDLVSEQVLVHKRASARVVYVGKRGGCASTPQEFIEKLMIAEANTGRKVVRLKGGDPFMFGRGGEERQHLIEAGLRVEVINGVSSGMAAATSLGVPLTHRDYAHGCIFVTGHGAKDAAGLDWVALGQVCSRQRLSLVIYMGVASARHIQNNLLVGGMSPQTPVAIVQSATLEEQQNWLTCLDQLSDFIRAREIASPAIFVVGEVARLADGALLSKDLIQFKEVCGCSSVG